jgi:hypothetical protein
MGEETARRMGVPAVDPARSLDRLESRPILPHQRKGVQHRGEGTSTDNKVLDEQGQRGALGSAIGDRGQSDPAPIIPRPNP